MAIGCKVKQVAKSLVCKGRELRSPVVIIASGPNRVREKIAYEKRNNYFVTITFVTIILQGFK